ncbi:hypothetical protein SAMN05660691_03362 [Rheinheimera pacifica]|uniref:Uncharacterized protein n=1 Tax=Rheinheimera pacifica TaxID=173990 RepID=A0A1H6NBG1_9GAMM|nr:hypothetical protein [Rheinheimera pacifica]SEI07512.1 hypothetical protein SAMN05660691_03362 [Rheinheimera pacifica]
MRILLSFFLTLLAFSAHGLELCKAEKGEGYVMEQLAEMTALDAQGQDKLKPMLAELKKAAKMTEDQLLNYSVGLLSRPELSKLYAERMTHGLKLMSLVAGKDCDAFIKTRDKLAEVAKREWEMTFKVISADMKKYK